jgi:hypothetical protein
VKRSCTVCRHEYESFYEICPACLSQELVAAEESSRDDVEKKHRNPVGCRDSREVRLQKINSGLDMGALEKIFIALWLAVFVLICILSETYFWGLLQHKKPTDP